MKLFQCDWCEKQKPCRPMTIDGKSYDMCVECRANIEDKLKGKGEIAANPLRQIAEEFSKQRPWPTERTWTLGQPPLLIKTCPGLYPPQIIGKSDRENYISGGILTGKQIQ